MAKRKEAALTRLELKVMQVIWKQGASTVGEVQEAMEPALAYTTVQTMLNILERKGKLARALKGRAFVYRAAVSEQKAVKHALSDLVERMFGGSSEALVMSLVRTRQLDAAALEALAERVQAAERTQSAERAQTSERQRKEEA